MPGKFYEVSLENQSKLRLPLAWKDTEPAAFCERYARLMPAGVDKQDWLREVRAEAERRFHPESFLYRTTLSKVIESNPWKDSNAAIHKTATRQTVLDESWGGVVHSIMRGEGKGVKKRSFLYCVALCIKGMAATASHPAKLPCTLQEAYTICRKRKPADAKPSPLKWSDDYFDTADDVVWAVKTAYNQEDEKEPWE